MKRFLKKWGGIALMIIGAIAVANWLGLIALLSSKTAVVEWGQKAPEIGRKFAQGAKDGITGVNRYDDVELLKDAADHLQQQLAAKGDLQKVWEQSQTWPLEQLNSARAPKLDVQRRGEKLVILAVIQFTDGEKAVEMEKVPLGAEIAYWDLTSPIHVDRAFGEPGQPVVLYPAAQRTKDGLSFVRGWVYADDLAKESSRQPAVWSKASSHDYNEWWIELSSGQQSPEVVLFAPSNGDVRLDVASQHYPELLWSVGGGAWSKPSDGIPCDLNFPIRVRFQAPPWVASEVVRVKVYNKKEVTQ